MSLSVPNVSYSYAEGPIGFKAVGASAEISANSSLSDIYEAYATIFGRYSAMHTTLLGQLGVVLNNLLESPKQLYDGNGKLILTEVFNLLGVSGELCELDLSKIFDNNELIDVSDMRQGECKEGAKAYTPQRTVPQH